MKGRHGTDAVSLVFGLLFILVAAWWAADHYLGLDWRYEWDVPNLGWFVAGALILLGLLGIVSTLRRGSPDRPASAPPPDRPDAAAVLPASPARPDASGSPSTDG